MTSTSSIAATEEKKKNSNQRNIVNQKSRSRPATMKQRTLSDQFIASADYQLTFAERIMRPTHTEDTRRRQAPRRGPDGKIEGAGEQATTRDLRTRKFAGSFENAPLYGNSILERLNYRVWTLRQTFLRRNSARCINQPEASHAFLRVRLSLMRPASGVGERLRPERKRADD